MTHDILVQIIHVLMNDSDVLKIVNKDNISASVREPVAWPSIEVDVAEQPGRDPKGHLQTVIRLFIHSKEGADECWKIEKAVHACMTAKKLTPTASDKTFKVAQCRQTDVRRLPRGSWAASLALDYSLRVAELNPVSQSQ